MCAIDTLSFFYCIRLSKEAQLRRASAFVSEIVLARACRGCGRLCKNFLSSSLITIENLVVVSHTVSQ